MGDRVQIVFEVDKDAQGRAVLKQVDQGVEKIGKTSKETSSTLGTTFAIFKGTLLAQFFQQGLHAAVAFGTGAVAEINKLKAAQIGLASVATFKGIGNQAAQDAVNNLDLVKSGLLTVSDASKALQNLLASGFGLKESVTLLQRFGDASAFNRQAALGFGEAIVGATEGIKNQNSMLVDNVGITKNLDKILGDYGFNLQDLSDKTKGQAARQALFNGLVAESAPQVGNAAKLTTTFAGAMSAAEAAQTKFMQAVGEAIISNKSFNEGLQSVVVFISQLTAQLNDPKSDLSQFFASAVSQAGELTKLIVKIGGALSEWHVPAAVTTALNVGLAVVNPGGLIDFGRAQIEAAGEQTKTAFHKLQDEYKAHAEVLKKAAEAEKTHAETLIAISRASDASRTQLKAGGSIAFTRGPESPLNDQIAALAKLQAEVHSDNPFVTLYAEGRRAQDELEKSSKGFTSDLRVRLLEVQREAFNVKRFGLEASSAVQAAGLRASAGQLAGDRSFEGRAADRAVSNIGMLSEAGSLSRFAQDVDPIAVALKQIQAVISADLSSTEIARKVEQITGSFDRDTLQGSRLGAFRAQALSTLGTEAFKDPAVEAAKIQLAALAAVKGQGNIAEEAIRRSQFLSVTGGLRADQLDPELRAQVVQAKLDEAKSLETQRQQQIDETAKLNALISKLLERLSGESLVKITLKDESGGVFASQISGLGQTPTPENTGRFVNNSLVNSILGGQ